MELKLDHILIMFFLSALNVLWTEQYDMNEYMNGTYMIL